MATQLVLIDNLIVNYKKKYLNLYILIFQLLCLDFYPFYL